MKMGQTLRETTYPPPPPPPHVSSKSPNCLSRVRMKNAEEICRNRNNGGGLNATKSTVEEKSLEQS